MDISLIGKKKGGDKLDIINLFTTNIYICLNK